MEYGEKMEKARAALKKKEKINEAVQSAFNKIRNSSNNMEKIIGMYERNY